MEYCWYIYINIYLDNREFRECLLVVQTFYLFIQFINIFWLTYFRTFLQIFPLRFHVLKVFLVIMVLFVLVYRLFEFSNSLSLQILSYRFFFQLSFPIFFKCFLYKLAQLFSKFYCLIKKKFDYAQKYCHCYWMITFYPMKAKTLMRHIIYNIYIFNYSFSF